MEYQVRFEEAGKIAGPRAVLYGMVEAESAAAAVSAAVEQIVQKLGRHPLLAGFKAVAVWSELGGLVAV